jgi:hypothetical protein
MRRSFAVIMFCSIAVVQLSVIDGQSQIASPQSALKSANASADIPAIPVLPPAPRGKSTILGGEIRSIDPVRDELTLKVYGQHPVKILFDERTQVYRDGNRIPLKELGSADHASVQTILDGTNVFALSIHMLSKSPTGEYQGRVVNYNTNTNELTISSAMMRDPIKFYVPSGTPVVRVGQPAFSQTRAGSSDLVRGALISVEFESDKQGRGTASNISVLATPGSAFVFVGDISVLDLHAGVLSLFSASDDRTYRISFNPSSLPGSHSLHPGDHVMVTTVFDGTNYQASGITNNGIATNN